MTELRRIERIAAESSASDQLAFQQPMTSAWNAYVTSNNMLNELRGLTRNYPFSSEALDDAKWRVSNDPESNRSWNYAWLVLVKLKNEWVSSFLEFRMVWGNGADMHFSQMISAYAASEAAKPEMWGGEYPDQQDADQLATCFAFEWNEALEQMLRHWETPPTTTGYWMLTETTIGGEEMGIDYSLVVELERLESMEWMGWRDDIFPCCCRTCCFCNFARDLSFRLSNCFGFVDFL